MSDRNLWDLKLGYKSDTELFLPKMNIQIMCLINTLRSEWKYQWTCFRCLDRILRDLKLCYQYDIEQFHIFIPKWTIKIMCLIPTKWKHQCSCFRCLNRNLWNLKLIYFRCLDRNDDFKLSYKFDKETVSSQNEYSKSYFWYKHPQIEDIL